MPTLLHAWSARSGQPDKKRQDRLPRSPADLGRAQVPALTEPVEAQKLEPLLLNNKFNLGLVEKVTKLQERMPSLHGKSCLLTHAPLRAWRTAQRTGTMTPSQSSS